MNKLILILFIFIILCVQKSHAIRIYTDISTSHYYSFVEKENKKYPKGVNFPIIFYMFSIMDGIEFAKKMEDIEKLYPDGIPCPLYVGYLVVDEEYNYTFVDKTKGIANYLSAMAKVFNTIEHKTSPRPKHPDAITYGKFSDFWHYKDRFLRYTLVDRYIMTMGIPPDDTFSLDEKDTIITPLHGPLVGNGFDLFDKIKRDNPPGRSVSKQNELAP